MYMHWAIVCRSLNQLVTAGLSLSHHDHARWRAQVRILRERRSLIRAHLDDVERVLEEVFVCVVLSDDDVHFMKC